MFRWRDYKSVNEVGSQEADATKYTNVVQVGRNSLVTWSYPYFSTDCDLINGERFYEVVQSLTTHTFITVVSMFQQILLSACG